MKLLNTACYNFNDFGIPIENNLNLIALVLTSRKIKHDLKVNLNFDPDAYVKNLDEKQSAACAEETQNLFNFVDSIGKDYPLVEAAVHKLNSVYKITLLCYGE